MGGIANSYKIKVQKKKILNLHGKTLKMRKPLQGKAEKKNSLYEKIGQKYYSSISPT